MQIDKERLTFRIAEDIPVSEVDQVKHPPSYQHYFSLLAETTDLLALMCSRRTRRAIKAAEAK
jgi:hypothetical protein